VKVEDLEVAVIFVDVGTTLPFQVSVMEMQPMTSP
jgi:hypothetical protein